MPRPRRHPLRPAVQVAVMTWLAVAAILGAPVGFILGFLFCAALGADTEKDEQIAELQKVIRDRQCIPE